MPLGERDFADRWLPICCVNVFENILSFELMIKNYLDIHVDVRYKSAFTGSHIIPFAVSTSTRLIRDVVRTVIWCCRRFQVSSNSNRQCFLEHDGSVLPNSCQRQLPVRIRTQRRSKLVHHTMPVRQHLVTAFSRLFTWVFVQFCHIIHSTLIMHIGTTVGTAR